MKQINVCFLLSLVVTLQSANLPAQSNPTPLVVHEWGTFTSLQDESGRAIGGINTDDEPVPKFVHGLGGYLLLSRTELPDLVLPKSVPNCDPDVTMRLETPVLYFHPAPGQAKLQGVVVAATFRGGWLSEYYPNADVNAPGFDRNTGNFGPLRSSTTGTLAWTNLEVGGNGSGPETTEHVWTSPRAVQAASVRASDGEAEKFLFYRGVAHIDSPMAVSRDVPDDELTLHDQCPSDVLANRPLRVDSLWLVDIRADGRVAFRTVPPVTLAGGGKTLATISSRFVRSDYDKSNRGKLEASLHDALVSAGLFDDEARALLNTWELSYFKSAGTRLFFLVPQAWTDHYLPLKISVPTETTRVMVGRIELVTPEQRGYLKQIAETSTNEIASDAIRFAGNFVDRMRTNPAELDKVDTGRETLKAFGISVPKLYQSYLSLGRFRNALILDEAAKHPSPAVDMFISTYRLQGYKPVEFAPAQTAQNP